MQNTITTSATGNIFSNSYQHKNNIHGIQRSDRRGWRKYQILLGRTARHRHTPGSVRTRAAVLAPARASPSAAAAGSATHFFTRGNPSAAVPLAYLSSSAAPADAFSLLSAAEPGRGFAPLSAAGLGFGQGGTTPEKHFRLS